MRISSFLVVLGLALCVAAIACGPTSEEGGGVGGGADGDGPAAPDSGAGGGVDAATGTGGGGNEFADAAPEDNCGVQQEVIDVVEIPAPPDLLIVLDRSGSMGQPVDPFDIFGPTKWQVMVDALTAISATEDGNIRFGLSVFPTDDMCGVAAGTEVAIGDGTAGAIETWLAGDTPLGSTPAHLGLQNALEVYNGTPVNPHGRYVLFATDGVPNCGAGGTADSSAEVLTAVEALYAQDIKTFVLGYGAVFGLDLTNLNDAAQAGGVPRPGGPPFYYHADSAADLAAALDDIAGGITEASCEYQLTDLPPDPDAVTVTIDGASVPRSPSHTDGWDYHPDPMHITFFGSYCDMIEAGGAGLVSFTFGCPGPVVD